MTPSMNKTAVLHVIHFRSLKCIDSKVAYCVSGVIFYLKSISAWLIHPIRVPYANGKPPETAIFMIFAFAQSLIVHSMPCRCTGGRQFMRAHAITALTVDFRDNFHQDITESASVKQGRRMQCIVGEWELPNLTCLVRKKPYKSLQTT